MKKLKHLIFTTLVFLSLFGIQTHLSQAADEMEIVLTQPDGSRRAMKSDVDDQGSENCLVLAPKVVPKLEIPIPLIARGYEAIYKRFLKGKLIYKPNQGSDIGVITLPIGELITPLEGTFDLSRCGDAGKCLSISTGYRKEKKPENADKVEIWITLRFLIEKEIDTMASQFKPIMNYWEQEVPVGLFWTWGDWASDDYDMDYLISENMDNLSKVNLYQNWEKAVGAHTPRVAGRSSLRSFDGSGWPAKSYISCFVLKL